MSLRPDQIVAIKLVDRLASTQNFEYFGSARRPFKTRTWLSAKRRTQGDVMTEIGNMLDLVKSAKLEREYVGIIQDALKLKSSATRGRPAIGGSRTETVVFGRSGLILDRQTGERVRRPKGTQPIPGLSVEFKTPGLTENLGQLAAQELITSSSSSSSTGLAELPQGGTGGSMVPGTPFEANYANSVVREERSALKRVFLDADEDLTEDTRLANPAVISDRVGDQPIGGTGVGGQDTPAWATTPEGKYDDDGEEAPELEEKKETTLPDEEKGESVDPDPNDISRLKDQFNTFIYGEDSSNQISPATVEGIVERLAETERRLESFPPQLRPTLEGFIQAGRHAVDAFNDPVGAVASGLGADEYKDDLRGIVNGIRRQTADPSGIGQTHMVDTHRQEDDRYDPTKSAITEWHKANSAAAIMRNRHKLGGVRVKRRSVRNHISKSRRSNQVSLVQQGVANYQQYRDVFRSSFQ